MLLCGSPAGRPSLEVARRAQFDLATFSGSIVHDAAEALKSLFVSADRPVLLVIDSIGGALDDAWLIRYAMREALRREVVTACHIVQAEGAALLVASQARYVFADPRASLGNLQIKPADISDAEAMLQAQIITQCGAGYVINLWAWFRDEIAINPPHGLTAGRTYNAEAAELHNLTMQLGDLERSLSLFGRILDDLQ